MTKIREVDRPVEHRKRATKKQLKHRISHLKRLFGKTDMACRIFEMRLDNTIAMLKVEIGNYDAMRRRFLGEPNTVLRWPL